MRCFATKLESKSSYIMVDAKPVPGRCSRGCLRWIRHAAGEADIALVKRRAFIMLGMMQYGITIQGDALAVMPELDVRAPGVKCALWLFLPSIPQAVAILIRTHFQGI
jgi:hypothetical protein